MKKIVGLLLAILIALPIAAPGAAADQDKKTFELASLGIVTEGELQPGEPVARQQLALFLLRLARAEESAELAKLEAGFFDVPKDSTYRYVIAMACRLGLLTETGGSFFSPEKAICWEEALHGTVRALGYGARIAGGDATSVVAAASGLGLLKQLDPAGPFLGKEMLRLLSNALDVVPAGLNDPLRDILSEDKGIFEHTGVVTATSDIWLLSPRPRMRQTQIEIDGVLYDLAESVMPEQAASCLGMTVYFYLKDDDRNDNLITAIAPAAKNDSVRLERKDVIKTEPGRIFYDTAEEGQAEAAVAADAMVVRNGRRVAPYTQADYIGKNGSIRMIDNDGDGEMDLLWIEQYQDVLLESAANGMLTFQQGDLFDGKPNLSVDEADKNVRVQLLGSDGGTVNFSDLAHGQVLSIAASDDRSFLRVYISQRTAEGAVLGTDGETVTIGDTAYDVSDRFDRRTLQLGEQVTAYLNFRGELAGLTAATHEKRYGYIAALKQPSGVGGILFQLIEAGRISTETKIDDTQEDNIIKNPILKGRNRKVHYLETEDRIRVDGRKLDFEAAEDYFSKLDHRFVSFRLDSRGKLTSLETLEPGSEGVFKYYNAYEKTFGKTQDGSVFAIDDDSVAICLPENKLNDDRDYLAAVELNDNQQYKVTAYHVDETTFVADLICITATLRADAVMNEKKVAIASSVSEVIDENGEERLKIDFFLDGEKRTAFAADACSAAVSGLRRGDVFRYAMNAFDELVSATLIQRLAPTPAYTGGMKSFGQVNRIEWNQISQDRNRWVTRVWLSLDAAGTETERLEINKRNPPAVYMLRKSGGEVKPAKLDDITIRGGGNSDELFVYTDAETDKMECVVIVRQ